MQKTFQDVWIRWHWRPIRHCPGRFVLPRAEQPISFEVLIGSPCTSQVFSSHAAKDPVFIVPLADGGIISYKQKDGQLVHTLNTLEGFSRKLRQLGIAVKGTPPLFRE